LLAIGHRANGIDPVDRAPEGCAEIGAEVALVGMPFARRGRSAVGD
jgi:hypothetical protein